MKEKNDKLPALNQKILQIIEDQFGGNVSSFARTIGFRQQTVDRLLKIDSRTNKYPNVSGKMIVAITSNIKSITSDWLLKGENVNLNVNLNVDQNVDQNASLSKNDDGCTEPFLADAGKGCPNCKIIETKYYEARDYLIAKEGEIKKLNREIGRLEGEVERLRTEIDLLTNKQDDVA